MASSDSSSSAEIFLEKIGLEKYRSRFESQGYNTAFDLCLIEEEDLDHIIIRDPDDRAKILEAAAVLDIEEWLKHLGLTEYLDRFRAEGIKNVRDLKNVEFTEELLNSLEIMIPGHRKRVKWSATFLKWHKAAEPDTSTVVLGYWGQPPDMEDNQHPFLCVPGYLKSDTGENARSSELIHFIVDSGSDVVTASEKIIADLQLEYIRDVESRGAHSAADRSLYRGVIKLGSEEFAVEVMPEAVSSVGNVVMRKFKHYITETLHRWLKDDKPEEETK
ncbi:uncharacterized protein LOC144651840 [Oculina patagonica]